MQISFYTERSIEEFSKKNGRIFPNPPDRCPFKDCSLPVKLKRHGYYSRYLISRTFKGIIYIRRYICPVCGRTVSMLPMYCVQRFQYSGSDIISMLNEFYESKTPLMRLIDKFRGGFHSIERRHINYYRKRIIDNRQFIQYGLNLISPEFIYAGSIPENQAWAKDFLERVNKLHPHVFLVEFSKHTEKSFMTLQNIIA
jgi:hypothetical protein